MTKPLASKGRVSWATSLKDNRRVAALLVLLLAVLKWRFVAAWLMFLIVLAGDPGTGVSGLVSLGREGRGPLLFMLKLDRWKGSAVSGLERFSDDPSVIVALSRVVREDEVLRGEALRSLGKKGAPEALPILKEYGEIEPLTRMGEPGRRALLEIQANFPRPTSRRDGADRRVWALAAVCEAFPGDADVRERVSQELQSSDVELRVAAVRCQRFVSGEGARLALRDLVKSAAEVDVRIAAAGELGKLGDDFAYDAMKELLLDSEQSHVTRCRAARALGEIGDERIYPALRVFGGGDRGGCVDDVLWKMFKEGDPRRPAPR